jgi:histidinol-phosphate/aromatic aminotransferase/cobyric acid decarboxylase-like protein
VNWWGIPLKGGSMQKSRLEKGGFPLDGINLALCENPLPAIDEAIEAAKMEAPLSNHYTEPYSYHIETFFFLGKVPTDADEFAKALSKKNINIRPIYLEYMENRFLKFAASTDENNRIVLRATKEILR